MKCEHCNNDMTWHGSLQGGRMHCIHCELIEEPSDCLPATRTIMVLTGGANPAPTPEDYMDYDI